MSAGCLPVRTMDDCLKHCGIISTCQLAVTSEIVKPFWTRTDDRIITSVLFGGPRPYFFALLAVFVQSSFSRKCSAIA